MDIEAFCASLNAAQPPPKLSDALRALWIDAQGNWDGAHDAAQADEGGAGDWVHAYLHRKEGDAGNAAYWYRYPQKMLGFADIVAPCGPLCMPGRGRGWCETRRPKSRPQLAQ